ncbi:MAG: dienelactone hydrolase family protein [Gammaproteobacteria bacterium]
MNNSVRILIAILLLSGIAGAAEREADEVAATAGAHRGDEPVATPLAEAPPRAEVVGRDVSYGSVEGVDLHGFLARPAGAGAGTPGLIVIHEWWGLNDNIRQVARRLAGEGYVALAVDLYDGESASVPKQAIKLMTRLTQNTDLADANLRQAYAYLTETVGAPRVGSIGWCLGGRWSLRTALLLPDQLDATVIYYGTVVTDEEQLAPLTMPVLGNFAEHDPIIPLKTVDAFTQAMEKLGKDIDVKVYAGAKHAFSNPSGLAYDPVAAADAWARTTKFLRSHLAAE